MSDQPRCVSNWPPAYDNLSYSITVPRISLNFNDPSYGMLRVLRCMHFIHLLLSFSLLRARGLSTFARRFSLCPNDRSIHRSVFLPFDRPFSSFPLFSFLLSFPFDTLVSPPLDYSFKRTTIFLNSSIHSPSRFTRLETLLSSSFFSKFFFSNSNNFLAFVKNYVSLIFRFNFQFSFVSSSFLLLRVSIDAKNRRMPEQGRVDCIRVIT